MVIFHSYVSLPEDKPPFSYGFPIFPWFSLGFQVGPKSHTSPSDVDIQNQKQSKT